jgi:hypothetical protein
VLFYAVYIDSLVQLQAFRARVNGHAQNCSHVRTIAGVGQFVRELEVDFMGLGEPSQDQKLPKPMRTWNSSIRLTLLALPLLHTFTTRNMPITDTCIVCLNPPPSGCITSLTLTVFTPHGCGWSTTVLSHINKLSTLKHLDITYDKSNDLESQLHDAEPLKLPQVQVFAWCSLEDLWGDSMAKYVTNCRFHPSCDILLDSIDTERDVSTSLVPFFDAHKFSRATLILPEETIDALACHIMAIDCVKIPWGPPPLSLLNFGRLPSKLVINIQLDEPDSVARLWEFLQHIPPLAHRDSQLTELSIIVDRDLGEPTQHLGDEFEWCKHAPSDHFHSKLAVEASRLYDEGIIVVDGPGLNIKQTLNPTRA